MKIKSFIIAILLIWGLSAFAQKKQIVVDIQGTRPVKVTTPFMLDSVNIKGEKFDKKEMLKTQLAIPVQDSFTNMYEIDNTSFLIFEKPAEQSSLQLFSFYVSSDRYGKGTLKITSPNMLELYIDGKLVKSKTEQEDSINTAKNIKTELNPYPTVNKVVIKLLSSADDKLNPMMKIDLENEKNDSITNFFITNHALRRINFSDISLGKRISNVKISPQGSYILIFYRDMINEKSVTTSTELYNIKTQSRVVIDVNGSKRQLNWMPESEKIYYTAKFGEQTNLIIINPVTLEEQLFAENIPNENFIFSPDEKALFYTKQDTVEDEKSDLKQLKSLYDRQSGYLNRSSVYRFDLTTGISRQLTFGKKLLFTLNDVSDDAKKLLISFQDETITERPFRKNTMILLDINTMQVDTLWQNEGFTNSAVFSPDSKKILVTGSGEAFCGIGLNLDNDMIANSYNTLGFIMDLKTKNIEPFTKDFAPSIEEFFWNKKDNLIYLVTTDKDYQSVYSYNIVNGKFSKLPLKEDVVRTFNIAANSLLGVYTGVSTSNSTKSYFYDLKTQKSTLIADPYNERLSQLNLGVVKDWNFVNSDGIEIEGRYYLPPNFDSSKKYPLIVYYYGGTTPTMRIFDGSFPPHVFAAQDYIVYVLQPSGTIGFGQKFAAMHVNAWGKRSAEDIIEGTSKFVAEHSYVNDKKIGCIGASYGGFMTMYLLTVTDMFTAAVSHAGISSISSYWGEGTWGFAYSSGASANSYPWNNHDLYVNQSPLFSADKINTPLLLTHGMIDNNVPIGESIQMFTALKILGKPVELIQIKDENHGVANFKRRIEWNNSIMAWFAKWLKDDGGWWEGMFN